MTLVATTHHICRSLIQYRYLPLAALAVIALAVWPCHGFDWSSPLNRVIRKAADEVEKAVTTAPVVTNTPAATPVAPAASSVPAPAGRATVAAPAQQSGGTVVFSSAPINPAAPPASQAHFKAGDHIYALITVDQPWRAMFDNATDASVQIPVKFTIGTKELFQYITVNKPELIKGSTFVLDIAPAVDKMTAYRDPAITYPLCSSRTFGPFLFTDLLGKLPAGTHPLVFSVAYFGKTYATGACDIQGADFSSYATLNKAIKGVLDGGRGMPAAGMVNHTLEAEIKKLCENAGWKNIARIVIVDKDWWTDYYEGSGSPEKSRHLAAAVAAQDGDGSCYYCTVTFHQPKLISGGYGALELTHTGMKNAIAKENIGK